MAAQTYPTVTTRVGNFNQAVWQPLMSQRLDPGYIGETFRYGMLSQYFDILDLAERTINLTTDNPKVYEKSEWEQTVTTGTAITTGAAGASISFTIDASDQDSVLEHEVILIPELYQAAGVGEDRQYVVTDVTSSVVTALPRSADGTSVTASQIGTEIPAGTTLSIVGYSVGRGGALPDGKADYRTVRDYETVIIDESRIFEGGMQALKWYEVPTDVGGTTAWFEGQHDMELNLSKHCEGEFWMGELNDNASLTTASAAGGTNKQKATKGVWTWAKEVGSPLNYSGGTFDYSYLYDVKDLFLSKMVAANEASFLMGSDLQRSVEEGGLDFVREYSGGSDLFRKSDELGIHVKRALVNGILFQFQELKALGNPQRFGNKVYNLSKSGLIVPESMENAEYNGKTEKHPSLQIGYLNHNGEDRTRIVGVIDGTTGRSTPTNIYDTSRTFIKSEFAAIVLRPEQLIPVEAE